MNFSKLSIRLVAWNLLVVVGVLLIYSVVVTLFIYRNADSDLDSLLRSDARWAEEMVQVDREGVFTWYEGDQYIEMSPWLQVWSNRGEPIYRTAIAQRLQVENSDRFLGDPDGFFRSLDGDPAPFRMFTRKTNLFGRPVIIQVGRSEALMRQEIGQLVLVFLLGVPLGLGFAGFASYVVIRRTLKPLVHMGQRARDIRVSTLQQGLPIENPYDEVGEVGLLFNKMLKRLDVSFREIQEFSANVSHQIRSPLAVIRSVGETGLSRVRSVLEYQNIIGSVLEEVDRLTYLTDRLLMIARSDREHLAIANKSFDLGELLKSVVSTVVVLAENKDQDLTLAESESILIDGDPVLIREATMNLVDNAIKYTPSGGTITVFLKKSDGYADILINDSGPGLAGKEETRVFDRYRRGQQDNLAVEGVGLGLALASKAVEAHGGSLRYERSKLGGSCFILSLPIDQL